MGPCHTLFLPLTHCRDGLHLSTLGYTVLFDKIESLIKTDFVGRGIDWDDLDGLPFAVPE